MYTYLSFAKRNGGKVIVHVQTGGCKSIARFCSLMFLYFFSLPFNLLGGCFSSEIQTNPHTESSLFSSISRNSTQIATPT